MIALQAALELERREEVSRATVLRLARRVVARVYVVASADLDDVASAQLAGIIADLEAEYRK